MAWAMASKPCSIKQLASFLGGVRLELVGHGSGLLFSLVTKKKPILAHYFFKQTDRLSSLRVRERSERTRRELESDEFTEEKLH
jgi:hypothetical protein